MHVVEFFFLNTCIDLHSCESHHMCIHQCLRFPTTQHMLDFRVWMSLQSVVENLYFHMQQELTALCNGAMKTSDELSAVKFMNVYK